MSAKCAVQVPWPVPVDVVMVFDPGTPQVRNFHKPVRSTDKKETGRLQDIGNPRQSGIGLCSGQMFDDLEAGHESELAGPQGQTGCFHDRESDVA
jgi:hypothetical protein